MAYVMTNKELVAKALDIANNHETIYALGAIGQKMSNALISNVCSRPGEVGSYNRGRKAMYQKAIGKAYVFDCVCLIKAILWGWKPGVVKYGTNGVGDMNSNVMTNKCIGLSRDFSNIEVGEIVSMPSHIGIYIGNNKVVECTPAWDNGVQITELINKTGSIAGWKKRKWDVHGKLPWVDYKTDVVVPKPEPKKEEPKPIPAYKMDAYKECMEYGLITSDEWIGKLDDDIKVWTSFVMMSRVINIVQNAFDKAGIKVNIKEMIKDGKKKG